MKTIKFEITMDVNNDFVEKAKRLIHHVEELLELESYPEIKNYEYSVKEIKKYNGVTFEIFKIY